MRLLASLIEQQPHATLAGLVTLMGSTAPHVSDRTMRKYIRELNLSRCREGIHAFDTSRLIALRTAWARQQCNAPILQWLFMDTSTLMLRHTGDYVWTPRGGPVPPHSVEHLYVGVNVWGVVWNTGSVFAQYRGQLTSRAIYNLLMLHLQPPVLPPGWPHSRR